MARGSIPARLRRAGVPAACWTTNCEKSGLGFINVWADGAKERQEDGAAKTSIYIHCKDTKNRDKAMTYVELHARQVCIQGIEGKHLTFSRMIQVLRYGENRSDSAREEITVFDVFARGFLSIPHLPLLANANCTPQEYEEAMGFLASHLYEGGLLITSGPRALTKQLNAGYPDAFEKVLFESSDVVEV